jgi:hypothetical protein
MGWHERATRLVASTEEHRNALETDYPMFSKPMPSGEVLAHLG